jgi:signal recognition particle subunit SRP68
MVEIDNLREKAKSTSQQIKVPLVHNLRDFPVKGVDLESLVDYPPQIRPIPVKPLFFDVAWNYIDYPGKTPTIATEPEQKPTPTPEPKKKGWFGFGR